MRRGLGTVCLCVVALGCGKGAATRAASDAGRDGAAGGTDGAATPEVAGDMATTVDGPETMTDAASSDVTTKDAAPADVHAADATSGTDGGLRVCAGQPATLAPGTCRSVADCGPIGPVVCSVGRYDWGPAGCPLPPGSQPCPNDCAADADCSARAGGKCDAYQQACPKCNGHVCRYPPPPCTSTSCGAGARCRTDGTCELIPCNEGGSCEPSFTCNPTSPRADQRGCQPIPCDSGTACPTGTRCNLASSRADAFGCEVTPCDDGYACAAGARCRVGSARADAHGCELMPCNDGYACPENTRCTVTAPVPPSTHGCTTLACKSESDCDCGYCIGGTCSAVPGTCQYPPV